MLYVMVSGQQLSEFEVFALFAGILQVVSISRQTKFCSFDDSVLLFVIKV
jgi:hypothetical protein